MKNPRLEKIAVVVPPNGKKMEVPKGTTLMKLAESFKKLYKARIVAARVNNDIKELTFAIEEPCRIEFVDISQEDGMRIYRRSLCFILVKAVHDLFPDREVLVKHSISKGLYCEVIGDRALTAEEVEEIKARMLQLVGESIPFVKKEIPIDKALDIFMKNGRMDRYHAVEHRKKPYVTVYSCGGFEDYFYGYMVPHTGYIDVFELKYYPPGLIVIPPDKSNPETVPPFAEQRKLFSVFTEHKKWGKIVGVENVGALNDIISRGEVGDLIRVSEALHEKKIAQIADIIAQDVRKRIVLISGPSSSGKTTFAHRLSIQLKVNGIKPVTISLDDYFLDRKLTPKDKDGEYDYEALEAIDLKLFNFHMEALLNGHEVEIPVFNFIRGEREEMGRKLKIGDEHVLLIEGIHGLNERLTASIPRERKFKIYVSALTSLNIDDHNRIPTTDTRLVRRIVRDYQFRGSSALATIRRWPSVRRGEERNIFPFQEEADVMFNSALPFELGALKTLAEPLLYHIDRSNPEFSEAKRLTEFLSYFLPIEPREIPGNSIIREFIGGSCFY